MCRRANGTARVAGRCCRSVRRRCGRSVTGPPGGRRPYVGWPAGVRSPSVAGAPELPRPRGPGCLRGSGEVAPSAPRRLPPTVTAPTGSLPRGIVSTRQPNPRLRTSAGGAGLAAGRRARRRSSPSARLVVVARARRAARASEPSTSRQTRPTAMPKTPWPPWTQVDDLVGGGALVDAGAVAHQRDLRQVVDAALAQVGDGGADVLQRDAGVEQPLDDLEHEDVAEAVEPLACRSRRRRGRWARPGRCGPSSRAGGR